MKSRTIALCGVLTALAVLIVAFGALIPSLTFAAPLLAMAVLLPVLEECGSKAAAAAYAATAILSLLLAAGREAALVYLFFGWYSILRPKIAARSSAALRVLLRCAVCSVLVFLLYGVLWNILGLPKEWNPPWLTALMLAAANALFLLADFSLARFTDAWHWKFKKYLFR